MTMHSHMAVPSAGNPTTTASSYDDSMVRVHYLAGRAGCGPVILFLHANGFHIKCTTPLASHFGEDALCIGIEFRGQGSSQAPDPAENLVDAYLQDVFAVVQALHLQGCYCFGHSGGAQVALVAEAQQPGTFSAIYTYEPVLSNVAPESGKDNAKAYKALRDAALRRKARFESRQEVEKRYRSRPPFASFQADAWQAYLDNNFTETTDGAYALTCLPKNEARWFFDAGAYSIESLYHLVPKVRCPVQVAVGRAQGNMDFLVSAAEKQVHRFPNAKLHRFGHLGHLGPMEDPAAVAQNVMAFFQSCQAAGGSRKAKL